MAFIPAPGVMSHQFLYTLGGQQIENVLHTQQAGYPFSPSAIAGFNAYLIGWWIANIKPLTSDNLSFRGVRSTDLTSSSGAVVETPPSTPQTGGVTELSLPNNVTIVITHRTASRGRSYRGRTYMPGLPSTDEDTSTDMTLAEVTNFVTAFATLASTLLAIGAKTGVLSNFAGGAPRSTGVFTEFTSHDANTAFDSQRRRLLGRGN